MQEQIALLRRSKVEELTGRSYTSIRRDIRSGRFPAPVEIGPRAIAWRSEEVYRWIRGRQLANLPPAIRPSITTASSP